MALPRPGFPSLQGSYFVLTIDRNARARLLFVAEALDRRTHQPGQHGGVLKRTGLAVLRALLFTFANLVTGRCDPGYDALARAAGVSRSTLAEALKRLEEAGLLVRIRRQVGTLRFTNVYRFRLSQTAWSESRSQTTNKPIEQPKTAKSVPGSERINALLAILQRRERQLGLAL